LSEPIIEESFLHSQQFAASIPSFMDVHLIKDVVEDEMRIMAFNFGFPVIKPLYNIKFGQT
jgi:hypothetical protein